MAKDAKELTKVPETYIAGIKFVTDLNVFGAQVKQVGVAMNGMSYKRTLDGVVITKENTTDFIEVCNAGIASIHWKVKADE